MGCTGSKDRPPPQRPYVPPRATYLGGVEGPSHPGYRPNQFQQQGLVYPQGNYGGGHATRQQQQYVVNPHQHPQSYGRHQQPHQQQWQYQQQQQMLYQHQQNVPQAYPHHHHGNGLPPPPPPPPPGGAPPSSMHPPGGPPPGYFDGLHGGPRPAKVVNNRPPPHTGRTRALLIGINYYNTSAALRGCVNDVKTMVDFLQGRRFATRPGETMVLTDDARDQRAQPTRQNILVAMAWLVKDAQPGDALFFHFSGHGGQQEDPTCSEEDCMDETICPVDFKSAGQITDNEIFDIMVKDLPAGCRLTAVMDCCHSGTAMDLPFTLFGQGGWQCEDNPAHSEGDVLLFSGCEDEDCSADASNRYGSPAGAMTTAFIDVVGHAQSRMTFAELIVNLNYKLQARGFSQRPQLTSSQRFDPQRMFDLTTPVGNANPSIGRHFTKKKSPRNQSMFGGPLGSMLIGACVAWIAMDMLMGPGLWMAAGMMEASAGMMMGAGMMAGDMAGGMVDMGGDIGGGMADGFSGTGDFFGDVGDDIGGGFDGGMDFF